jgi:hypothetical protein
MSNSNEIKTPRGTVIQTKNGIAKLVWNEGFGSKWNGNYSRAQAFVDSEVLRKCDPYIPLQSGILKKSGTLGTEIGSGEVDWIAPYARKQYYDTPETRVYDPMRGSLWFERMKADHGAEIIAGAKSRAGGTK